MKFEKNLSKTPSLTIGIPTFNEEKYIGAILESFLKSNYSGLLEILVCDGGSTDTTREIVLDFNKRDPRVTLLHNQNKTQVYAFNMMIERAKGELLMIAGSHALYDDHYIEKCITLHKTTEALNVGGPTRIVSESNTQLAILIAWYSFLGNGGAKHRNPNFTGYTDTLFPGCYVTEALRTVGGFNTQNIANQDSELNLRLSSLKKNAHYIDSKIQVCYFPRDSFKALLKQYFRYGRGRFITSIKHFPNIPLRGYISFLFLWINVIFLFVIKPIYLVEYFVILVCIALFDTGYTLIKKLKNEDYWIHSTKKQSLFSSIIFASFALFIMHLSMGVGFTIQLLYSLFNSKKKNVW